MKNRSAITKGRTMRDYISIGSAPRNEDCVQVNPQGDYHDAMRAECRRFLDLIQKKLGLGPPGAYLAIESIPHDFGTYYDVVCYFNDEDEQARAYALRCEADAPETWEDDHLSPEAQAHIQARERAREGICGLCGEELEDPYMLEMHMATHARHARASGTGWALPGSP